MAANNLQFKCWTLEETIIPYLNQVGTTAGSWARLPLL